MKATRSADGTWQLGDLLVNEAGHGRVQLRDCGRLALEMPCPEGEPGAAPGGSEDDEYLVRPFRMLSACLIEGHWVDFSDPALFRDSVQLFEGVTIFRDHRPDVACWVGVATKARFSERGGTAGIDADYKINKAQDEALTKGAIVRGLSSKPPAIRATSVGISFKARKSHPEMSPLDFWLNLGREVDGQIVRHVVEKLKRVHETSLVYSGADPNARAFSAPRSEPMKDAKSLAAQLKQLAATNPELAHLAAEAEQLAAAPPPAPAPDPKAQADLAAAQAGQKAAEERAEKLAYEDLVRQGKVDRKICGPAHEQTVRQNYATSEELKKYLATAQQAPELNPAVPAGSGPAGSGAELEAQEEPTARWVDLVNKQIKKNELPFKEVSSSDFAAARRRSDAVLPRVEERR